MKKYHIKLNKKIYEIEVEEVGEQVPGVSFDKETRPETKSGGSDTEVLAPLPGTVLNINVDNGAAVKAGDLVMVLEAMKMENEILAPRDGRIDRIHVTKGANVATGECLLVMS